MDLYDMVCQATQALDIRDLNQTYTEKIIEARFRKADLLEARRTFLLFPSSFALQNINARLDFYLGKLQG